MSLYDVLFIFTVCVCKCLLYVRACVYKDVFVYVRIGVELNEAQLVC